MAVIRQSAPALLAVVTPDAGLETQSISIWGAPALLAVIGSPGSIETAALEDTSAIIRQTSPALAAIVGGGAGTLTLEDAPGDTTAVIRQTAPVLAAVVCGAGGQIETADLPPLDIPIVIGAPYTRWGVGAVYV